ncbi:MAG: hypothetical protein ABIP35_04405 [Ginsengibacter sp.]
MYAILIIKIASFINWTNGIALLGFIPLLIDIFVKWRLYKKHDTFNFNEIFDFDFFKSLAIGILIFTFALFENSSSETKKQKLSNEISELKTELETTHERDSSQSVLDRESDKKDILTNIGNAIGKYSLGYDSAKNEIVKLSKLIKDSANRQTTIIESETPILGFAYPGLVIEYKRNDSIRYKIIIASMGAGSVATNLKSYVLISYNNIGGMFKDLIFVIKNPLFSKKSSFPKESAGSIGSYLYGDYSNAKSIVVYLTGSYTDSKGNNRQEIRQVGFLNEASNEFSLLSSPYDDYVIDFLKSKNALDKLDNNN